MEKSIGFIGFGEAAFHIAKGFSEQGIKKITAFDAMLNTDNLDVIEFIKQRAADAKIELVYSIESVMKADIVFIAIPAKFAKDAALNALQYMDQDKLFIDITTNKPSVKEEIGAMFESKGACYADASVMGAVPLYRHKTPTIVSGNGAKKTMEIMLPLGMDLTYVGEQAGMAVKMKLTRSIFIKGIEALTLEMLLTARSFGIEAEIMEGLHKSFDVQGFTKLVSQLVTSNVQHSARRAVEAEECCELIEEAGFEPIIMRAVKSRLEWSAERGFKEMKPVPECKTLNDLYELWEKQGIL